jgi:hypothetical protein
MNHERSLNERVAANSMSSDTACVLWTGARTPAGYGVLHHRGRTVPVHRALWEEAHGPLAAGDQVVHTCCSATCSEKGPQDPHRRCILHLEVRSVQRCRHGHRLEPRRPGSARRPACRECGRRRSREHAQRKAKRLESVSDPCAAHPEDPITLRRRRHHAHDETTLDQS